MLDTMLRANQTRHAAPWHAARLKPEAMQLLSEGRELYREGKYKEALDKFNAAYSTLPAAPVNDQRRQAIANNIGDASIAVAQEYIKVGRYDEADKLLQDAIRLNPKKAALANRRSNT